jgi:enoyl-CoA hydratase/carnithine racemase
MNQICFSAITNSLEKEMDKVIYEKKGEVAYITLNRPKVMNAVDWDMVEAFHRIWEDFKEDGNLRAAIMTGAGQNFCAGFDIRSMLEKIGPGAKFNWRKSAIHGDVNCSPLEHRVYKPIITAVDGNANGTGLYFVLVSDIRLATREAVFGMGEVKINFPVEFTALVPRFMPYTLASEMLITGKNVGAQRFYDLGLVNALVEREQLLAEAEKAARVVCSGGPAAIRAMKQLLLDGFDMDYASVMKYSDSVVSPVVNSADFQEGVKAFAEKRKPVWKEK